MAPRSSPSFRQTDVTRLLRAGKNAGFNAARVEIDPSGKMIGQFTAVPEVTKPLERDDLDRELVEFEARRGNH